ncbi:NFYB/HAP3 family transcription factor subunit [Candidatus Woesearchaeota archaeon]|nr:NFYB/HAP3 family transcription factor subunit [Candidatus Woesearchaeota archaeon]
MRKNVLPYAPAERMLKQAGARRVSMEAKIALMQTLEEEAGRLIAKAVQVMKNCNRKTLLGEDLRLSQ